MKRIMLFCAAALLVLIFPVSGGMAAEDSKFDFSKMQSVKETLLHFTGKRVALRIEAGEAIEGTVSKVGDQTVHISALAGKDYYDAVVRIDRISAVIFRAK